MQVQSTPSHLPEHPSAGISTVEGSAVWRAICRKTTHLFKLFHLTAPLILVAEVS
jgi:hypothetical protein